MAKKLVERDDDCWPVVSPNMKITIVNAVSMAMAWMFDDDHPETLVREIERIIATRDDAFVLEDGD